MTSLAVTGILPAPADTTDRLIRIDEVLDIVAVSRAHWYRAVARGDAPRPLHLGRTSVWRSSDIASWIASLGARGQ